MSKVVLSERQHRILDADRVTTMRIFIVRASVVKEDDLLAKVDIQANPEKVSKAPCTEPKTWFDNGCFKLQDISNASSIMTS
eukprot:6029145-Pyramimonas_sp.AAC.1